MKYYAFIDGEQKGPFELEELTHVGVRPSTYVWAKGMSDWQRADEVPDICRLFRQHLANHGRTPASVVAEPAATPSATQPDREEPRDEKREQRAFGFPIPESFEPKEDLNAPPQVSMTLAVLALLFCCPPTGIAAVVFASKAINRWKESLAPGEAGHIEQLRRQAHDYERLAKMWLGITVALGIIAWTLIFSIHK